MLPDDDPNPNPEHLPCEIQAGLGAGSKHTDGVTYTRCVEHMGITDESLGLAKPKAKPAKGPMRPEHDNVRMKPGLGLKQPPKQRQGLLTNHSRRRSLWWWWSRRRSI